jgi:anti-sigma B factor antagonist
MVEINTVSEGDICKIVIAGEIDASSSIHLDNAIVDALEQRSTKIIVDCTQLDYISSAGLGVFMSYIEDFDQNNIKLAIYGLSPKVKNVFEILGLDQLLKLVEKEEEAIQIVG